MIHEQLDPTILSEFHRYVRSDVVRIDIVIDDQTGMDFFDGLLEEDPDTGDDRPIILDQARRHLFHVAVGQQLVARLGLACPHAQIKVRHGSKFAIRFSRRSRVTISKSEIWAAIDAVDEDWWDELWGAAYGQVLDQTNGRSGAT